MKSITTLLFSGVKCIRRVGLLWWRYSSKVLAIIFSFHCPDLLQVADSDSCSGPLFGKPTTTSQAAAEHKSSVGWIFYLIHTYMAVYVVRRYFVIEDQQTCFSWYRVTCSYCHPDQTSRHIAGQIWWNTCLKRTKLLCIALQNAY